MSNTIIEQFEAQFPVMRTFITFNENTGRYEALEPYMFGSDSMAAKHNLKLQGWLACADHMMPTGLSDALEYITSWASETCGLDETDCVVAETCQRLKGMIASTPAEWSALNAAAIAVREARIKKLASP